MVDKEGPGGSKIESKLPALDKESKKILPAPTIDDDLAIYTPSEEESKLVDKYLKDGEFSKLPPGKIIRFLRARKLDEDQFKEMLRNHVTWTNKVQPYNLLLDDVNKSAVDSGCWRYLGESDEGCPILEVRLSLWRPDQYTLDEYEVYVAFFCSMSERMMKKSSQFVVIFDMAGWAFWHATYLNYIKGLVDIAQNQLPDRLRKVLLINTPFIFRATWAIIRPWLDPLTAAKVEFVVDEKEEVLKTLSINQKLLPIRYGGEMDEATEEKLPVPGFTIPMN